MTLSELLRATAQKYPDRPALLYKEEVWTYRRLYEASQSLALGLRRAGIRSGDRVAILLKNCPEFVASVFALGHLGACAVLVNFYLNAEEVEFILKDCGASAFITQSAFAEVAQVARRNANVPRLWVTDPEALRSDLDQFQPFRSLLSSAPGEPLLDGREGSTVLILYTSGTTGKSKGAMLSHRNLTGNARACVERLGIVPEDRFLCILPMFHVFAWTTNVLVPFAVGCPVVVVDSIRPPKPWLTLMRKHRVTTFIAVPQIYAVLAEQAKGIKGFFIKHLAFGKVRMAISGAAPLSNETLAKFEQRVGVPLLQGYGLTETSPVTNVSTLTEKKPGSVGKSIPGVRIEIADESGRSLPVGEEGEVCVYGENVMQGYFNQPGATKSAFTPEGGFRTGDVGKLDAEGYLYILDRIKDMIIVKGLKVFSAQVEEVLTGHPAVAEAAVVGVPSPDGDESVRAFVVLKEGASADKQEISRFCQEKLPPYKRPRNVEILKELPKNALQKVLKRELRARALASKDKEAAG